MTHLLSIDPGDPSGWSLWCREGRAWQLFRFGELPEPDMPTCSLLMGRLLDDCRGCHFVVEDQFYAEPKPRVIAIHRLDRGAVRKRKPSNLLAPYRTRKGIPVKIEIEMERSAATHDSVAKLIGSRCRWQDAAEYAGMTLHDPVQPRVWIRAMTRGHPEPVARKRVREVTAGRWRGSGAPHFTRLGYDEAAAILLGEYWIGERRERVMRRGAPQRGIRGMLEAA